MMDQSDAVKARSSRLTEDASPAHSESTTHEEIGIPLTDEQIRLALAGKIEPVRSTALYRLWIAVVAAVMVLLPLIYVSIITLLVAGLVYHARYDVTVFQSFGQGKNGLRAALAVYFGPLVIGGVVVLFMLKPIFARPPRREKLRVLDRESERLLHTLVDGVCKAVGAPRPSRIEVNCDVNASAHREGPFLGIFGSRLVLTIGLPLAAGLNLKQLTGVLAHEFGHFSQGAGMRLFAIIRTVNMWFARVVYERDAWDQSLENMASFNHIYVQILGKLTQLAVWLTRRVLWALMWVGHLVSSFLSRQMEFDADRYEARMVGGHVFAETMWRLRVMSVAQHGAYSDLNTSWSERRLPDDFSKLVLANVPQIPAQMIDAMRADVDTTKTGWFESHPSDKERSARAIADVPGAGIFGIDLPSSAVFADLDALSRTASLDYYRSIVDDGIKTEQLFSVDELVQSQAQVQEAQAANARFFLGSESVLELSLDLREQYPERPADLEATKQAIALARSELLAARDAHLEATRKRDEIVRRLNQVEYAAVALGAGLKINLVEFGLTSSKVSDAISSRDRILEDLSRLDQQSAPFAAAGRRLGLDLSVLEDDAQAMCIPDGLDRRREAHALYPCAKCLGRIYHLATQRLVACRAVVTDLAGAMQQTTEDQPFDKAFQAAAANLAAALAEVSAMLDQSIAYPFEHADGDMTLARYILGDRIPEKDDLEGLVQASFNASNRLDGLYVRAVGRLAATALAVEDSLGLPPLKLDEASPEATPPRQSEE